jgi:cell division septation protein DedD
MARGNQGSGASGWAWLLTGVFIGLFVAFLIYLNDYHQPVAKPQTAADDKPAARFDFYSILTEMEVPVNLDQPGNGDKDTTSNPSPNHHSENTSSSSTSNTQAVADLPPGSYIIQAGAFSKFAEADRLKAQLSLLGISAQIQTVKLDNGQTWHRVRIGPFASLKDIERIQGKLNDNDIKSLVVKLKQ